MIEGVDPAICEKFGDIAYCVSEQYSGATSFFGGNTPLSIRWGWIVVLGFGAIFSVITTILVYIEKYFGGLGTMTSEHFNTAGRSIKTGLTASVIISQWTWAATLLQSSNVAWRFGVSGPFWYASGATIQILLFGVIAISLKKVAPNAHTFLEIVKARWGTAAHFTFMFFGFCASIIVTAMLLLGGAATVEALTGMDYRLASFLIPWGVILYTAAGGLKATFIASYIHTAIIMMILMCMILVIYIKEYSSDIIFDMLKASANATPEECAIIFPGDDTYACGPVDGNIKGERLTMVSAGGLMFGIVNIIGNFGTVFVDQSYWQSAIAAKPVSAARGYLLGGMIWFTIPFSLATSLGLANTALMLPMTASEAGSGLVPPSTATYLLGTTGSALMLVMLFMAIVSTGSAESIAVSSLIAYDIYREYINPEATGKQILFVSRIVIVGFGVFMGAFSIALNEMGLNLGWVYIFMGIVIGSAVIPLWNMMTWDLACARGAVAAAWGGFLLAVTTWLVFAKIDSGYVSVETLGKDKIMVTGNLVAIISSGIIHYIWSKIENNRYDFSELNDKILLVEDSEGIKEEDKDPEMLEKAYKWITIRGWAYTFILAVVWPVLSIPAQVFTRDYFAFWVLVSIVWGFAGSVVIIFLPVIEVSTELGVVLTGMKNKLLGRSSEK